MVEYEWRSAISLSRTVQSSSHMDVNLLLSALRHRMLRAHDDYVIARVDELLGLNAKTLELREKVLVVLPDRVSAAIDTGLG